MRNAEAIQTDLIQPIGFNNQARLLAGGGSRSHGQSVKPFDESRYRTVARLQTSRRLRMGKPIQVSGPGKRQWRPESVPPLQQADDQSCNCRSGQRNQEFEGKLS